MYNNVIFPSFEDETLKRQSISARMQKLVGLGLLILVICEHVDLTLLAESSCSADTMDEISLVKGNIVENDETKVLHVHASGCNVCSDQHSDVSSTLLLVSSLRHLGVLAHNLISLV